MSDIAVSPITYPIRLFEPSLMMQQELVRYQSFQRGYDCHPADRHFAVAPLGVTVQPVDSGRRIWSPEEAGIAASDPRWPARCAGPACPHEGGYLFAPEDPQLVFGARMMAEVGFAGARVAGAALERLDRMPVGSLWRAQAGGLPLLLERDQGVEPGDLRLPDDGFFVVATPTGPWWLYLGDDADIIRRCGRFHVDVRGGEGLRLTQDASPPASWAITDGRLRRSGARPQSGRLL